MDQALKEKMEKVMGVLKNNFVTVRTGRANPGLVENVQAECYGTKMPLQQLATITAPESRLLVVSPFDRGNLQAIIKAIQTADLGLNPQDDGHVIRIILPDLNEERRKELGKLIKQYAEEAKVSLRNIRRDFMDGIKKVDHLSEDDIHRQQDQIQKTTDLYVKKIEELLINKEKEVLNI